MSIYFCNFLLHLPQARQHLFERVNVFSGEAYNNIECRLGGDADLTPRGTEFAKKLGEFVNGLSEKSNLKVWTSWLKRAIDTAQYIDAVQER